MLILLKKNYKRHWNDACLSGNAYIECRYGDIDAYKNEGYDARLVRAFACIAVSAPPSWMVNSFTDIYCEQCNSEFSKREDEECDYCDDNQHFFHLPFFCFFSVSHSYSQ